MNVSKPVSIAKSKTRSSSVDSKRKQNPSSSHSNSVLEDALEKVIDDAE